MNYIENSVSHATYIKEEDYCPVQIYPNIANIISL